VLSAVSRMIRPLFAEDLEGLINTTKRSAEEEANRSLEDPGEHRSQHPGSLRFVAERRAKCLPQAGGRHSTTPDGGHCYGDGLREHGETSGDGGLTRDRPRVSREPGSFSLERPGEDGGWHPHP